ncbi:hypothetical protein bcere0005_53850 [Bacillus cereus 172560W]|nr:hypothetical protein bcere0005_53850 [Bacillus cereus 172560W]
MNHGGEMIKRMYKQMLGWTLDGVLKLHEAEAAGRASSIDFLNEKRIDALIVAYYKQPFQNDSYFTFNQIDTYIIPYLISHCGDGFNQKHFNSALSYKGTIHKTNNKMGLRVNYDVEFGIYQTIKELNDELKHRISTPTKIVEDMINSSLII